MESISILSRQIRALFLFFGSKAMAGLSNTYATRKKDTNYRAPETPSGGWTASTVSISFSNDSSPIPNDRRRFHAKEFEGEDYGGG